MLDPRYLGVLGTNVESRSSFPWKRIPYLLPCDWHLTVIGWPHGVPIPTEDPTNKGIGGVKQVSHQRLLLYLNSKAMRFEVINDHDKQGEGLYNTYTVYGCG